MNLGLVPYGEAFELQRSLAGAVSQGAIPETVIFLEHPPVVTIGHRTETESELHIPEGRCSRDRGDRPRRQVDVPRPGTARLLPDPRPARARQGREALRPQPRAGAHPNARGLRARRSALRRLDRRVDGSLERTGSAEDRVHRRARVALGDHARVRPQRRSRPGAVHGVDHGVRARGRAVHDDGARARASARCRRGAPEAIRAIGEVFGLVLEELPADDGAGLWRQSIHAALAAR